MRITLVNAISIKMMERDKCSLVLYIPTTLDVVRDYVKNSYVRSAVGHESTAQAFSMLVGREVPVSRESITLEEDDILLLGEVVGPRLPEGVVLTEVDPESVKWWIVRRIPEKEV